MTIVNIKFTLPECHVPQNLKRIGDFADAKEKLLIQQDNVTCKVK